MDDADAPERLQLHIVLGGAKRNPGTVRVVCKTRDHEKCIVEGEGFVFKRARRTPPRALAAKTPKDREAAPASPRASAGAGAAAGNGTAADDGASAADAAAAAGQGSGDQAAPDAAAPGDQAAREGEGTAEPEPAAQTPLRRRASAAPPVPAPLGPLRFSMATSELAYLVQWVLATELRLDGGGGGGAWPGAANCGDDAAQGRAEALSQAAADRFEAALLERARMAAATAAGGGDGGGGSGGAAAAGPGGAAEPVTVALAPAVVLPFQVARLKARLAEKLDWLLQVERAWDAVEARYAAVPPAGEEGEGHRGAPALELAGTNAGPAPMDADPAGAGAATTAGSGAADAGCAPQPGRGSAPALLGTAQHGAEPEPAARLGSCLADTRAAAEGRMLLQAEEMEALATKAELIATEAEAVATALQARFHSARFCLYPHINSPALLIKSLIRPDGGAGAGADA